MLGTVRTSGVGLCELILTGQQSLQPSNTLMFTNLPLAFFESEELVLQLQELLQTYGPVVEWSPLPAFGRGVAVFERAEDAANVKRALDRLLLLYENGREHVHTSDVPLHATGEEWVVFYLHSVLRVYFCGETPLILMPDGDYVVARSAEAHKQFLEPPPPEREFLLSPPGSPPVGWEQREEERPNQETLAQDLIDALQKLVASTPLDHPPPAAPELGSVVLVEPGEDRGSLPGVMVHPSGDDESNRANEARAGDASTSSAPVPSLSSVKATARSQQGRPPATARPPM